MHKSWESYNTLPPPLGVYNVSSLYGKCQLNIFPSGENAKEKRKEQQARKKLRSEQKQKKKGAFASHKTEGEGGDIGGLRVRG